MKNYFEILGISEGFLLDEDELEEKYLGFQRDFHPDKAGVAEVEKSILVNEAFEVLGDEFSRLSHLLQLKGIDIEDDSKAPKVDFVVLQEIFELQERLTDEAGKEVLAFAKKRMNEVFKEAALAFEDGDFSGSAQKLMQAKYFKKLRK